jgi:hypothetical protein
VFLRAIFIIANFKDDSKWLIYRTSIDMAAQFHEKNIFTGKGVIARAF